MNTPNNKAGSLTETIMARVKAKCPDMDVPTYNRVYEAVHECLAIDLAPPSGVVNYAGGGGMLINRARR